MLISNGAVVKSVLLSERSTWPGASLTHLVSDRLALSGLSASYGHIYKSQLWVYVVVNKRAHAVSRLPLKVYQRDDLGREEDRDHPYARLLRRPNPVMSPAFLWLWTESTRSVYGEALWVKIRPGEGRPPVELWPWHPANVGIERKEGRTWYFDLTDRARRYESTDIVHFKTFNPESTSRGLSPLEPLRQTLLNEDAARRATSSFWQRGARPGMALVKDGNLSQPAADRLAAQMDRLAGGVDKTGKTLVFEEGLTPHKMDLSAEEAQYIETRKLNREEVCGAFDIPPPVVHILDRATFSNITEQMRSLYRDTMAPILGSHESDLALQLQTDFGDDAPYAEFLMDEVLRGSFEQRMEAYAKAPHMMISEIRSAENLPPVPGTDRIFINSASKPIAAPDEGGPDIDEQIQRAGEVGIAVQRLGLGVNYNVLTAEEARALLPGTNGPAPMPPAPRALPAAEMRSVLARLSRPATLDDIDPDVLTKGLNGSTEAVLGELELAKVNGESVADLRTRVKALGGTT